MIFTRAVHSLNNLHVAGNKALLSGKNGAITIEALREGIYGISYIMDLYKASPSNLEASKFFFDTARDPFPLTELSRYSGMEESGHYGLICGKDRITLEKAHGLLCVFHDDKIVHGGHIGTADTVLPRYPFRILDGNGDKVLGRMNFKLQDDERFFGLGEKSGGLNRRNRLYKMHNRDALAYKASFSDPLYKSVPFLLKHNGKENSYCGLFFPCPCLEEIDLGRESPYFFSVDIKGGPFSYYLFTGFSAWDILEKYTWLTGRPALPPLFTFGFLGSSMNYTEPKDAEKQLTRYFDEIEAKSIPCEGFYFSSGYVKADNGERYTFVWNRKKFPDPAAAITRFRKRGYHIACNVKPGILISHPRYDELSDKGYFIRDSEGKTYTEYYWGNDAALVDFSNPEAFSWWKLQIREKLLQYGVSGIWNDNNEYELEDQSLQAQSMRTLYPSLMAKAAWEIMEENRPGKRPWIISRSGTAGIQKYARTWTGDNVSDWESLKYNTLMGLGLGLSGIPFYGHDIGGFFGEKPDEKQFIRWCQSAVFQPRFVIHSWNRDGKPTELWSYPEALDTLRELVELHYEFMPYIYNCAIHASLNACPMERPLALVYPEDTGIDPDCLHYMFGEDILVLSAVEKEEEQVECYLPKENRWYDPLNREFLEGGQSVTLQYPYHGVRYLFREGAVIFRSPGCRKLDTGFFPYLLCEIHPSETRETVRTYYEDDGESTFQKGSYNCIEFRISLSEARGNLTITAKETVNYPVVGQRKIELRLAEGYCFIDEKGNNTGRVIMIENLQKDHYFEFQT